MCVCVCVRARMWVDQMNFKCAALWHIMFEEVNLPGIIFLYIYLAQWV